MSPFMNSMLDSGAVGYFKSRAVPKPSQVVIVWGRFSLNASTRASKMMRHTEMSIVLVFLLTETAQLYHQPLASWIRVGCGLISS